MDTNKFIDSIENELFNRIRNSKSDAEASRLLKEHQALQFLQPDVSGSVFPDVNTSEKKLREMSELHKPNVLDGKSDFHLSWRLCYEWICKTDR